MPTANAMMVTSRGPSFCMTMPAGNARIKATTPFAFMRLPASVTEMPNCSMMGPMVAGAFIRPMAKATWASKEMMTTNQALLALNVLFIFPLS